MKNHMAIDQYGNTYHDLGRFPRKALMARLGARGARKMYQDGKDGKFYHTGYVVRNWWCKVYEVEPWRKQA